MENVFKGAVIGVVVAVGLVGIGIYGLLIVLYLLAKAGFKKGEWVVKLLDLSGAEYTFGIPIAGVVTTVVVYLFGFAGDGKYTFKAFSFEFSGPVAPATLWIVTFITFIATIRILRRKTA
jgi:hypothetical protein